MITVNDVFVIGKNPITGDVLNAQKPIKPQKEIHGKGFKELLDKEMRNIEERDRRG